MNGIFPKSEKLLLSLHQMGKSRTAGEVEAYIYQLTGEVFDTAYVLLGLQTKKLVEREMILGAGRLAEGNRDPRFRLTAAGEERAEEIIRKYGPLFRKKGIRR